MDLHRKAPLLEFIAAHCHPATPRRAAQHSRRLSKASLMETRQGVEVERGEEVGEGFGAADLEDGTVGTSPSPAFQAHFALY